MTAIQSFHINHKIKNQKFMVIVQSVNYFWDRNQEEAKENSIYVYASFE